MKNKKYKVIALAVISLVLAKTTDIGSKEPAEPTPITFISCIDRDPVVRAIAWIESNFDPHALGTSEDVGILQITPVMLDDVNRIVKTKGGSSQFSLEDRLCPEKSCAMFYIYNAYYGHVELEQIARGWNAGPRYFNKGSLTDAYVEKFYKAYKNVL